MNKVFHFDSPAEPYRADATVVWCFDDRFSTVFRKFLRRIGAARVDVISVAGGAKALASPPDDPERIFILDEISLSLRLHDARRIIVMLHSDCGAYGGLAAFRSNAKEEAVHHWNDLARAAEALGERFPGMAVETYFVDFSGVWSREDVASAA